MKKHYYQILGVSKTATSEEIKKAYRKLALKWHPDRQGIRSPQERLETNKKMQEINKAYEILSDEDKKKRYDAGETNFAPEFDWNSYYEAEKARIDAELERVEEEGERIRHELKIAVYTELDIMIRLEMSWAEVYPQLLDNNLWKPYDNWQEKLVNLEILFKDGRLDETNSPACMFGEEMVNAIKKRGEELRNGINNPYVNQGIKRAIEVIEDNLKKKNLKVEDLDEKYRNYREHINSLMKLWKIRDFRDEVIENIQKIVRFKNRHVPQIEQPSQSWLGLRFFRSSDNKY